MLDRSDLPVLILVTASRPELAERPVERAHLDALAQRPDVMRLSVGRLKPHEHARLIQQILGLDPALARTLRHARTSAWVSSRLSCASGTGADGVPICGLGAGRCASRTRASTQS